MQEQSENITANHPTPSQNPRIPLPDATTRYNSTKTRSRNRTATPRASYKPRPLTERQYRAVELLVSGLSDHQTADAVQAHRVTVTNWRLKNPLFRATLAQRRLQVYGNAPDQLRNAMNRAVSALKAMLKHPQPTLSLRAASTILSLAAQKHFRPEADLDYLTNPSLLASLEQLERDHAICQLLEGSPQAPHEESD